MNDVARLSKQIDALAKEVGSISVAQGKTLQKLDDMEIRRIEDRAEQKGRCDDHGKRITNLEKGQVKIGILSGTLGTLAGWFAGKH